MTSYAIHPDMQPLIESSNAQPPATTIQDMRDNWRNYSSKMSVPPPEGMDVRDQTVELAGRSPVPVRIYRPASAGQSAPCVLYFHGGGFMKGDLDSSDTNAWGFAELSNAVVISVDYRLAPENPFPAGFDDCYTSLEYAFQEADTLGIDRNRIVVCGDSAGGNLAAAVALAARDRKGPGICAQVLIYPCLTNDLSADSYVRNATPPGLTTSAMGNYWEWYIPADLPQPNDYATPLRADDLSNLPPAFIHTAEFDPLDDDGRQYRDRLESAGVSAVFRCADGMIHGFMRARLSGETAKGEFAAICDFIREATGQT